MVETLENWFFLRDGRSVFAPDAVDDASLVLCHQEVIETDIQNSIVDSFIRKLPIKMVLYGDWGAGKTHAINHMAKYLKDNDKEYPVFPIIIEFGDIEKKSRFDIIVRPILDEIGINNLIDWISQYQEKTGKHISKGLAEIGLSSTIRSAFNKFLMSVPGEAPTETIVTVFNFLRGESSKDSESIGLGQQILESKHFVDVLKGCAEIYSAVHGKTLLYIADEAARMEQVQQDRAILDHWVHAHNKIFDPRNKLFGFIYTFGGKTKKNIPKALFSTQVLNRLGEDNLFELRPLDKTEVEDFLQNLVSNFVDMEKVKKLVSKGEIEKKEFDEASYPFTPKARKRFVEFWDRSKQRSKPRDITDKMDRVAIRALKAPSRLIRDEHVKAAGM